MDISGLAVLSQANLNIPVGQTMNHGQTLENKSQFLNLDNDRWLRIARELFPIAISSGDTTIFSRVSGVNENKREYLVEVCYVCLVGE